MSWTPTRLRFVADFNPPVRADLLSEPDREVSFLPMEAVGEDGSLNLERTRSVDGVRTGYSYFEDGDVAVAKVTPCFENGKGAIMRALTGGAGFGSSELTVLRPRQGVDARFLRYFLASAKFMTDATGAMTGAGGLRRVPDWFIRDYPAQWPDSTMQTRIANFLDDKTARIDALIAEKERLRKAVQEHEQAVASDLLARGVQRHRLLPTGKEFVPEAPENWKVVPLKRALVRLNQGWSPQCESRPAESGEWGVLKVGCVNGTRFNAAENKALPASLEPDLSCLLFKGDVLVSRANTRELVGKAALVDDEYPNLLLCDKLYRLTLRPEWVLPEFVVAVLRSDSSRRQIELGASGASSSMQNISQDVIRELVVALPPVSEQREIVAQLGDMRNANAALLQHVDEHVARLREYRSSLISAAVTGQLDLGAYKAASVPDLASELVES